MSATKEHIDEMNSASATQKEALKDCASSIKASDVIIKASVGAGAGALAGAKGGLMPTIVSAGIGGIAGATEAMAEHAAKLEDCMKNLKPDEKKHHDTKKEEMTAPPPAAAAAITAPAPAPAPIVHQSQPQPRFFMNFSGSSNKQFRAGGIYRF